MEEALTMVQTTTMRWAAGSLALAALVALGVAASVVNSQAAPTTPSPVATQTSAAEPAAVPTDYLPPEKAAIAAQEAKDAAENAAKAADPVSRAKGAAEKASMAAEAAAEQATAKPLTVQDVCQVGALVAEAPPGTHPTDFLATGGWAQIVGNECIEIYVGTAGQMNPNDGAVFIMHTRDSANAPGKSGNAPAWGVDDIQQLTVPGSGALTVQSAGPGGKFYLTSASGKTYTVLGQADQVKPGRV